MNLKLRLELLKELEPEPKEEREEREKIEKLLSQVQKEAQRQGLLLSLNIGGSRGKNTYLKGDSDLDVFVCFESKKSDFELSKELENLLKSSSITTKKLKGSRDYFQSSLQLEKGKKLQIEWVPTRKIKDPRKAENSTDCSIHHVQFLKDKVGKRKKLLQEIRLAKRFFKAHELYGAESYKEAFSGHILDLLILEYGSLEALLKATQNWKEGELIDPAKHFNSKTEALKALSKEKLGALIIIDPILKERNAARALSRENFEYFLVLAKKTSLERKDFELKTEKAKEYEKRIQRQAKKEGLELFSLLCTLEIKEETQDRVGSQMLKLFRRLSREIQEEEFRIFREEFKYFERENKVFLSYFLYEKKLPKIKKRKGPLLSFPQACDEFLKKYPRAQTEKGRLIAYEQRKISHIKQLPQNRKAFEKLFGKKIPFLKAVRRIE